MREQHAQVVVAALTDAAEMAIAARGVFLGRKAEPGGEVPCIMEVGDAAAGGGDHGGGGERDFL